MTISGSPAYAQAASPVATMSAYAQPQAVHSGYAIQAGHMSQLQQPAYYPAPVQSFVQPQYNYDASAFQSGAYQFSPQTYQMSPQTYQVAASALDFNNDGQVSQVEMKAADTNNDGKLDANEVSAAVSKKKKLSKKKKKGGCC